MKKIKVEFYKKKFLVMDEKSAQKLNSKRFGIIQNNNYLILSNYEVLFLLKENKIEVVENKKELNFEEIIKKTKTKIENFIVYYDLRKKGYLLRSGIKFGSDFRVYNIGKKEGEEHSKWLLNIIHEKSKLNLKNLTSNVRNATVTNKELILAIVDDDLKITYLKINRNKL
jgi:tRNA-intron endonuclease